MATEPSKDGGGAAATGVGPPSKDITSLIHITNECVVDETDGSGNSSPISDDGDDIANDKCAWCLAAPDVRSVSPLLVVDSNSENEDKSESESSDPSIESNECNTTTSIGGGDEENDDDDHDDDSSGPGASCEIAEQVRRQALEQSALALDRTRHLVGASTAAVEEAGRQSLHTLDEARRRSLDTIGSARERSIRSLNQLREQILEQTRQILGTVRGFADNSGRFLVGVRDETRAGWRSIVETVAVTYAPCYSGTAPGFLGPDAYSYSSSSWPKFLYANLLVASWRGFGSVVFCDNPVTGIWILLGMLCAAPLAGVSSLLSAMAANATALYFCMDREHLQRGQYAKNALIVGAWVVGSLDLDLEENLDGVSEEYHYFARFHSRVVLLFLSAAVLAPVTVWAEHCWRNTLRVRWFGSNTSVPSLLLPANAVIISTVVCSKVWNLAMITQVVFQDRDSVVAADTDDATDDAVPPPARVVVAVCEAIANSLSRIFLADHNGNGAVAALLVLIGALFCSRILAASLVGGAFVATVLLGGLVFDEPERVLDAGSFGFNPALSATAVFYYWIPSWKSTGLAAIAVIATVVLQAAVAVVFELLGISVSTTLGFCLTLVLFLSMDVGTATSGQQHDGFLDRIPESELSTPELCLQRRRRQSSNPSSSDEGDVDIESAANEKTPLLSSAEPLAQDCDSILERISEVQFPGDFHDKDGLGESSTDRGDDYKGNGTGKGDGSTKGTPLLPSTHIGTSVSPLGSEGPTDESVGEESTLLSQPGSDEDPNDGKWECDTESPRETKQTPLLSFATFPADNEGEQATEESATAPSTTFSNSDYYEGRYNDKRDDNVDIDMHMHVPIDAGVDDAKASPANEVIAPASRQDEGGDTEHTESDVSVHFVGDVDVNVCRTPECKTPRVSNKRGVNIVSDQESKEETNDSESDGIESVV